MSDVYEVVEVFEFLDQCRLKLPQASEAELIYCLEVLHKDELIRSLDGIGVQLNNIVRALDRLPA